MGTEKNTWRFQSILYIGVKMHNEMVVEMYTNSLGFIYGTEDIDNMLKVQKLNRSEQHKVQKASKDTHRKV